MYCELCVWGVKKKPRGHKQDVSSYHAEEMILRSQSFMKARTKETGREQQNNGKKATLVVKYTWGIDIGWRRWMEAKRSGNMTWSERLLIRRGNDTIAQLPRARSCVVSSRSCLVPCFVVCGYWNWDSTCGS